MRFSNISIDGFGVLSQLELPQLSEGLNVIHGTNGSGKTTIMHFIRGVLTGFEGARRLRLLPPLKGGNPGGSLTMEYGTGRYEVIRRARHDHADTLAINLKSGQSTEADRLRSELKNLDYDLLTNIFAVGGFESHAVGSMVKLALRDGIELCNRKQHAGWLNERIEQVETHRKQLFHKHPDSGQIKELEQKRSQLADALAAIRAQQRGQQDEWAAAIERLRSEMTRLQKEADWLHQELQLAQTELTEVNDRLWSTRQTIEYEQSVTERPVISSTPIWVEEIREIDSEISHAQQVLRDLATSRMELSIAKAELTGSETPDQEVVFERHRQAIHAIETQTDRLQSVLNQIDQAREDQNCICQEVQGTIGTTLESIRQQISLLCQELSRQQTTHEQLLLLSQREGVDRCEEELTKQIHRLRLRRDELLHSENRSLTERVQFCTKHEKQFCQCEDHQQYLSRLASPVVQVSQEPEVCITERVVITSKSLPGDQARQVELMTLIAELRRQWWHTNFKLRGVRENFAHTEKQTKEFSNDQSVQKVRYEYAVVEQQLADSREQWQSLAVLQSVLQRTQQELTVDLHSQVIEDASALLNKMTEGRYVGFHFYADAEKGFGPNELVVISNSGRELPMAALSRGTLDQAALSFRMGLWSEYQRRGIKLPLILDDVLPDSDESRLHAAATALVEFGQRHQQMLFFTCQEHLANMFEQMQVGVWDLPGSSRQQHVNRIAEVIEASTPLSFVTEQPAPTPISEVEKPQFPEPSQFEAREATPAVVETKPSEPAEPDTVSMYRIQPDEPFWLQTTSPASYVPSLGAQMARRLGALGVRHVSDLIELDPESSEIPLQNLQISASTLRIWKAEARLLCCVPDLTGRDAQLLVACGIMNPSELGECDPAELYDRIQRVRSEHQSGALSWLSDRPRWPEREAVANWIRRGGSSRSYRQARDWSSQRRQRSNQLNRSRSSRNYAERSESRRSHSERTPHEYESRSSSRNENFVEREISDDNDREWKFYLHMDSPVVDAPTIGPRMAVRLNKIGVMTVSDLINRDAEEIAEKLKHKRTCAEEVMAWQQQSILVCRIPQLRGHDAQVLVACGVTEPEVVASSQPDALFAIVGPFSNSKEGQRLLRSAKTPDLEEVTDWITFAQNARLLKAA